MSKSGFVRIVAMLVCVLAFGAISCTSKFSEEDTVERTGTLETALTSLGSDGATYSFPPGSLLVLSTGGRSVRYPLTGPEPIVSKKLQVGDYTLGIEFGQGGSPRLLREASTGSILVPVQWLDPQPLAFSISPNNTTSVTLSFTTPLLTKIKFSTGELEVGMDVEPNYRAAPSTIELVSTNGTTITNVEFANPSAAYASALAATVGSTTYFFVTLSPTGSWSAKIDAACIPVRMNPETNTSSVLGIRLVQLNDAVGELCVVDQGANDIIELRLATSGPPPGFQTAYLPDPTYLRELTITGRVATDLFDGETLKIEGPKVALNMTNGTFRHRLANAANATLTTLNATVSGAVVFAP